MYFRSSAGARALLVCLLLAIAASADAGGLDLAQYRGKLLVVDFWASWCQPCRHSFPWLNAMQKKYADRGLVVLGVNVDRERAQADRFLKDVPAGFDIAFDPDGQLAAQLDVQGMPSTYIFSPDGKLIAKHIGFKENSLAAREAEIDQLLTAHTQSLTP